MDVLVVCSRCAKVLPLALAVYQDGLPLHYVHAVHMAKVGRYNIRYLCTNCQSHSLSNTFNVGSGSVMQHCC